MKMNLNIFALKRIFILTLLTLFVAPALAQTMRMKDAFAAMPDSIFPLITRNNRLDCIDFIENNMEAQVKNIVDEPIEIAMINDTYIDLKKSE